MKCPLCDIEMQITGTKTVVEGDKSPDTETVVYMEQELSCMNPQCANCGKVVETVKHYLIGKQP